MGDEAQVRTAIGRAYYASFLLARDRLGIGGGGGKVHKAVVSRLHSKRRHKMARHLKELRNLRNKADYNVTITLSQAEAGRALGLAEAFIQGFRPV